MSTVPKTCKVNWVDTRRGSTEFELQIGRDISAEDFRKQSEDGEMWMCVEYSDPGSPYVNTTTPFAYFTTRETFRQEAEAAASAGFGRSFASDIHWPDLDAQKAGKRVSWPGSDQLCWQAPQIRKP